MGYKLLRCVAIALTVLTVVSSFGAEITDEQARRAIERGTAFLRAQQRGNGSFPEYARFPGGLPSLCTLALINSGDDVRSPHIQKSLAYIRSLGALETVYGASMQTMLFCAAEPEKDAPLIRRNVDWLQSAQLAKGRAGAWAYSKSVGEGDNSNTQFALLALHEAERAGVRAGAEVWQRGLDYWHLCQKDDGSWGYTEDEPPTGSMTCAGITSLIICAGRVHPGDAQVMSATGTVQCCCPQTTDPALEKGLAWLGSKFSASRNPSPFLNLASHNLYYYLYGVERVGRFTGQRFIGRHDWYRQGAEVLVAQQDGLSGRWRGRGSGEDDPLVATSFALLFLSKGRRPVVLGKLSYGESPDWNAHRSAVPNLARRIEQRWKRDLSWQTIDIRAATVEDLLEAPVLLITGRSNLPLSREQKENLRQYVNRGGFIFADASCGDQGFDRAFRALIRELFPTSPLRLLPPEHPVWYAEERVDPAHLRKLYGVEACCRTSIVYCAEDLSCYWELSQGSRGAAIPKTIQDEIEACLRIGENVVTYATNRELKNKLDRPQADLVNEKPDLPERGVLKVPKLTYDGGGDDAPHAIPALLSFIQREAQLRVAVQNQLISATETSLHEYPVVFMHGRRTFRFSPAERKSLAEYAARGGVLFADAICGSSEFADSFRREMDAVFSGGKLERIPPDHPLFTRTFRGFDLTSVTLRDPQVRGEGDPLKTHLTQITPLLEGLKIDDRYAVIFSPYDISCALETGTSPQCKGYTKEDAARLGLNVLLFALQQ